MGSGFRTFTAGEILTASNVQNYLQDQVVMTFAGSAARSSAIGTANFEEGMTSYLTDTDKMEVYNGTNWVGVAPASTQGLTLLQSVTFSAVSSQSINAVFSSTYENYRIEFNVLSSVGETDAKFRMRVSGSDDSTNNYEYCVQSLGSSSSSYNIASLGNQTSGILGRFGSESQAIMSVDVGRPNIAARTHFITVNSANGTTTYFSERGAAVHRVTTAYTGLTIFPASGTMTGTIRIYGYQN
jgi:hypothetical protein